MPQALTSKRPPTFAVRSRRVLLCDVGRAVQTVNITKETGGGVMAIVQRMTVENFGVNVGNVSETKLFDHQRIILSIIKSNPLITGKLMPETLSVTQRTVERDLAAMQKAEIIRYEGKVNVGIWMVLDKGEGNIMK